MFKLFKHFKKLNVKIYNSLRKWYIVHEDVRIPENGTAIFGPFRGWEISKRLNDGFADLLAYDGNIEAFAYPRSFIKTVYVNPRRFWMRELRNLG